MQAGGQTAGLTDARASRHCAADVNERRTTNGINTHRAQSTPPNQRRCVAAAHATAPASAEAECRSASANRSGSRSCTRAQRSAAYNRFVLCPKNCATNFIHFVFTPKNATLPQSKLPSASAATSQRCVALFFGGKVSVSQRTWHR